ncbi:triphosphoribosyl-dephospho-CoA synthase CitG [Synergistaceae bacterium OttesenSCG-928-I11]|nr:triphosphoribosyl-dephospho-CoA synthase CitG [Synergistaceae bacterium OttesenSCG-928-I11]
MLDEQEIKIFTGGGDAEAIGDRALFSMLCEVSATPKPGLVDRANNGAHDDMDFFTFMASASALRKSFEHFAEIGAETRALFARDAFRHLQRAGLDAEKKMFAATGGVNTHKGAIFSLGLVCGAAGRASLAANTSAEEICRMSAELCTGICDEAYAALERKKILTKGERVFLEHGIRGVRGEAEDGFPSVLRVGLPAYREMKKNGAPENDVLVQTLLHLMVAVHDTNVISRHNLATSHYVRERAADVLAKGGMTTAAGRHAVAEMDRDFILKNISPGGCADLLAVTVFLDSS